MSSSASSSSAAAPSSVATAATPEAVTPSPEAITETYVATWNETDPARRRAGIDAMLAGVQARFPGLVLKRTSRVDAHNGALRFGWSLGPASGPTVVEGVRSCSPRRSCRRRR